MATEMVRAGWVIHRCFYQSRELADLSFRLHENTQSFPGGMASGLGLEGAMELLTDG